MKVKAFAKINLTLDITGRRDDGYHTLDSIMHTVSLCDDIEITRSAKAGIRLLCNRRYLPVDKKNTAYRAAALFLDHCGLQSEGLELSLEKTIPSRAGMGGGSADAAAVLHALNEIFETKLPLDTLMQLGAEIGADVPFCVHGGACRCTGIGELLQPVTPLPNCFIAICKPPAGMSTPRAYAMIDQYPLVNSHATDRMVKALATGELREIGAALSNRFDEAMRLMQVKSIKKTMLSAGAAGAMMTGSGSAVYGLFESEAAAKACLGLLKESGECFLCRPVGSMNQ